MTRRWIVHHQEWSPDTLQSRLVSAEHSYGVQDVILWIDEVLSEDSDDKEEAAMKPEDDGSEEEVS
jgi:hypothetical protein